VARARGIDIRQVGSGNIGATNVFRALGKPAGIAVLAADILKGWLAVVLMPRLILALLGQDPVPAVLEYYQVLGGVAAVLGHNYTFWLGFRGGKGIATSAGVLLALVPWALLIILVVWLVVMAATRYVSLASICASFVLPFAAWLSGASITLIWVTSAMAALAILKHRTNILRLWRGTESRFGVKEARQ
jgi:glycerol-3-phosphate acyltransferase PlsY